MSNSEPLRLGILGAARIARRNWPAILHSGNAVIAVVASRNENRARQLVTECQARHPFLDPPRTTQSYEAVLADPTVDAVYVPLPTALRREWVRRAAEAGKHVLCEKPCAVDSSALCEMTEACCHHRVQFMDGVMFMHHPRMERLQKMLHNNETIGTVRRITSAFSFRGGPDFEREDIRMRSDLEPMGCLGDLGWYCIRLNLALMNGQLPQHVSSRLLAAATPAPKGVPVPIELSAELLFEDGVSAGFHCSFRAHLQQWALISGSKGHLRIPDFVLPDDANKVAWEANYQPVWKHDTEMELGSATRADSQETLMFRNFARQVRSGSLNVEWPDLVTKTQRVADACFASAQSEGQLVAVR